MVGYASVDSGEKTLNDLNGVVFLDIRKDFDSINHNIYLLRKMKDQFGVSNIELKWSEPYISDIGNKCVLSMVRCQHPKRCGVPQGFTLQYISLMWYVLRSIFNINIVSNVNRQM